MFRKYSLVAIALLVFIRVSSQENKRKFKDDFKFGLVAITDFSYEFDGQKMQKSEIILKPKFTYRINNKSKLIFIGQVYSELNDNLEEGVPKDNTVSKWSRSLFIGDRSNLGLRELYYQTRIAKKIRLSLGKQQIVWGETDGLKLLDVVNPQNLREFILDDFEDSRIPLWSVKNEFDIGEVGAQFVWIPDNSYHIIPDSDAPFFTSSLFPKAPEGVSTIMGRLDKPNGFIKDSDLGFKFSTFKNGWDISVNYFYYYDDLPVFYNRLELNYSGGPSVIFAPAYERQQLIGGTFNKVIGSSTIRGEFAYIFNQNYITTESDISNGIQTSYVNKSALGIDFIKGENIISGQVFSDIITEDITPFNRDLLEINTSLKLSREMMNDNLNTEFLWVHNYNHGDGFIRPQLSYWMNSSLQLLLESTLFYGNRNQLFGQFRDRNRVSIGMRWGI
jgi:hypothetical protein